MVSHGFDLHFLETNDVEHLVMNLLAICLSLEKGLFKSFARVMLPFELKFPFLGFIHGPMLALLHVCIKVGL